MLDEGNDDLSDEIEQESVIIESAQK